MTKRSARVNKNSYKKPFTFPSYKIYLWGILPGKSLTETKDYLARMSWLGRIQNMWPVHDPRSHSQGLCSVVPWPFFFSSFLMTWIKWISHPATISDHSGSLQNIRNLTVVWIFLSWWECYRSLVSSFIMALFQPTRLCAERPQWVIKESSGEI